jgi:hypothetical protein
LALEKSTRVAVLSGPTVTIEIVGNTGNPSSEKANVGTLFTSARRQIHNLDVEQFVRSGPSELKRNLEAELGSDEVTGKVAS